MRREMATVLFVATAVAACASIERTASVRHSGWEMPFGNGSAAAYADVDEAGRPASILYADDHFGLSRLTYSGGAGAYADQAGAIVTRWQSQWERPELWLFDFHHHLFAGDAGE